MGNLFGGATGSKSRPAFPKELGHLPHQSSQQFANDAYWGQLAFPSEGLYGPNSPLMAAYGSLPDLFTAGGMGQMLTADSLAQGYGQSQWLANQGFGQHDQIGALLGLQTPAFGVANQYAQGLMPAIQGSNVGGPSGAGNRVVDAGLNFGFDVDAIQQRAIAQGLPQVRASYSARGLGTSGEAARGEQDYVQRISDEMAQQAIQARLGGLNAAAAASGPASSEAVGFGNIGLGRGQLALQGAQMPGDVLNQFLQGQQYGLQGLGMAQQLQGYPQQLLGTGMSNFFNAYNAPLQGFQNFAQTARWPLNQAAAFMSGVAGTKSEPVFTGFAGIPYGPMK
jgi:hypothetical protein